MGNPFEKNGTEGFTHAEYISWRLRMERECADLDRIIRTQQEIREYVERLNTGYGRCES